jgi:hypothetical protein
LVALVVKVSPAVAGHPCGLGQVKAERADTNEVVGETGLEEVDVAGPFGVGPCRQEGVDLVHRSLRRGDGTGISIGIETLDVYSCRAERFTVAFTAAATKSAGEMHPSSSRSSPGAGVTRSGRLAECGSAVSATDGDQAALTAVAGTADADGPAGVAPMGPVSEPAETLSSGP